MAANSIGKAALILGTASGGLSSGLDKAYGLISGWKGKVAGALAGIGAGLSVSKIVGDIGEIATEGNLAKSLGMTPEAFTSINAVAGRFGVDTKSMLEGLIDSAGRVNEAIAGGQMSSIFQSMGLDAQKMLGMGVEERFYAYADAFGTIQDPAERARAVLKVFGEDIGKLLLPVMSQGGDAIRKMADDAKSAGLVVGEKDMAKVQRAQAAIGRAQAAIEGAWRRVVIAATPVAEFVADLIPKAVSKLGPLFDQAGEYAVPALHGIAIGAGYVWDTIKAGAGGATVAAALVTEGFGYLVQAFAEVLDLARALPDALRPGWVDDFAGATRRFEAHVKGTARQARRDGIEAVTSWGESARAMDAWFTGWSTDRDKSLAADLDKKTSRFASAVNAAKDTLGKALERGSKDEYSARVKFEFGGVGAVDKQQLEAQLKANTLLSAVADATKSVAAKLNFKTV